MLQVYFDVVKFKEFQGKPCSSFNLKDREKDADLNAKIPNVYHYDQKRVYIQLKALKESLNYEMESNRRNFVHM
jgi:hypothetical protein